MINELLHLAGGDDFWQRLDVLNLHEGQGLPVASAGAGVKELDATEGDSERSGSELLFVLEVQKELPHLVFGDVVGRAFGEVSQLADGSEIPVMRSRRHPCQVQVFAHTVVELAVEVL